MPEREYVLGTHDEEIGRLGLQHRVWRPYVLDAWDRAGLRAGQTALDVGCGPGYATIDLAERVGPQGRVIAIDQSRRFLDHLSGRARSEGRANIDIFQRDLNGGELPPVLADMAWCRWIFAFVRDPRALLKAVAAALRPGGALVIHEYYDYRSWRLMPPCEELDEFVALVMRSWRADGGEPDAGAWLPSWLEELGFVVATTRPLVEIVTPQDSMWEWPAAFLRVGIQRLVALGHLSQDRATAIVRALEEASRQPGIRMCTPGVAEIIAHTPKAT
jgi:SAM-dependent methyltransferase